MKRILSIILATILLISVCGCVKPKYESDGTEIVALPDETTKQTVNGYKQPSGEDQPETNITVVPDKNPNAETVNNAVSSEFIANGSTKKFHLSSCQYAKKIKEENLVKSNSRTELINSGYEPCKKCNP